jgi:hypothetical protein
VEVIRAESRNEGWARANGDAVAFFDTRYAAGPSWWSAVNPSGTVGGYVLPLNRYDWAGWVYYVVEYGWKQRLVAGNIVYPRSAAQTFDSLLPGGGRHDARMDVRLLTPPGFHAYLQERLRYSREWGRRNVPKSRAFLRAGLPLLILGRTPWWRKPATLPGVLIVSLAMAWGEFTGSLGATLDV